jgi:protein involved in plasmid replication-relaxation
MSSPVGWSQRLHRACSEAVSRQISPTILYREKGLARGRPMSSRTYLTSRRLESLCSALRDRQWALLGDVARLRVMSGGQLQRLHYQPTESGARLARLDLAHLTHTRALARLGRRIGGRRAGSKGYVYSLDVAGQRLTDPERRRYRRPWTPDDRHLRHALAVSELYVELREAEATGRFELVTFEAEPACWRRFFGPGGAPATLKPDAFVVVRDERYEDRSFLEVDCATEAGPRITDKAAAYVRYWESGREQTESAIFPRVLWVAPDEQRAEQLAVALRRLPAEHWRLFNVSPASGAVAAIYGGVESIGETEP